LIDKKNPNCPIRKQAIPSSNELISRAEELIDPLGDIKRSPIKGVTHRYPDRVLFYPTYQCAMYCRHCFRRRVVGQSDQTLTPAEVDRAISYIAKHKRIREVILTGGDPLFLRDEYLQDLLLRLKDIEHLFWIRIHTRVFVTLPSRITKNLVKILKQAKPLYIVTHANHPKEITPEFKKAVERISNAGITMLNQSVLLKGINNNLRTMKNLFYELLKAGVKPYYLHQCDLAEGVSHFRTDVQSGIDLLRQLRGFVSGLCVPFYMIDTPNGYGKVPVSHNYVRSYQNKVLQLETFKGDVREYFEP